MKRALIILSSYVSPKHFSFAQKHNKGASFFSSVNFSRKIKEGLSPYYERIFCLSEVPIGSYPNHSDIAIFRGFMAENDQYYPGFINFIGLRNYSIAHSLYRAAKEHILPQIKHFDAVDIIVVEAHYPYLSVAKSLKREISNCKVLFCVLDLPNRMNPFRKGPLYKMAKGIDNKSIKKLAHCCDCFLFLTEGMQKYFPPLGRPFLVVDAISDLDHVIESEPKKGCLAYTGTVTEQYAGVTKMIGLAKWISDTTNGLHIVVAGPLKDATIEASLTSCEDLEYLGRVSPERAAIIQSDAQVLLNLRENVSDFDEAFPSKLMEYLKWGKPIITYKTKGIGPCYDGVFFYPEDESLESLESTVLRCLSLTEEEKETLRAKCNLILSEKSISATGNKIYDLLSSTRGLNGKC